VGKVLVTLAVALALPSTAAALEGRLAGIPSVHGDRATLPLLTHGAVRDVRLARGWRIVHGRARLDLGALRIGDRLRVAQDRRRVVVVRRGTVLSFRALNGKLGDAQGAESDVSSALATLTKVVDRPAAESLRTKLNTLDEQVQSLDSVLDAQRAGIAALGSPPREAALVARLQAASDAGRAASGQLEQAVTQLDGALSLVPLTSPDLPFETISTVPALADSALASLKQTLPTVGNLLQAILAGG
jgi:hypothetical protein